MKRNKNIVGGPKLSQDHLREQRSQTSWPFQVVLEGIRGPGIEGDIAIDDVTLEEGECRNPPTSEFIKQLHHKALIYSSFVRVYVHTGQQKQWQLRHFSKLTPVVNNCFSVSRFHPA